ncbi:MAG: hypothetical protein ACOY4K_07650 [Pseudomonadota bacterium]
MIAISKLGLAYMVKATPPEVKKPWGSLLPMNARNVVEELIRHGCSLERAFDAMICADPDRAAKELR